MASAFRTRSVRYFPSGRRVSTQISSRRRVCDTGMSGQCRSDSNIELVRFLGSNKGDGTRAVFAGVQLLFKNNFPNDPPSKFAHR